MELSLPNDFTYANIKRENEKKINPFEWENQMPSMGPNHEQYEIYIKILFERYTSAD